MTTFRIATGTIFSCLIASLLVCADEPPGSGVAKKDAAGFLDEFRVLENACNDRLRSLYAKFEADAGATTTEDERDRLAMSIRDESDAITSPVAQKAFDLVRPHAADPTAIKPLFWIAIRAGGTDIAPRAAALLIEHHLTSRETIEIAFGLRRSEMKWVERLLRAQVAAPDLPADKRPRQLLALAQTLYSSAERRRDGVKELEDESISLFTEVGRKYADAEYAGGVTFGDLAASSLYEIRNLSVGKIAPDIRGEDLDGATFKLSDYRGQVVLISFWASWCGPCMAELPRERDLVKRYAGRPFVLIGVNADPDKRAVVPILEKKMVAWRSLWCGEKGPLGPIPRAWNVNTWLTTYLIDHTGVIQAKSLTDSKIEALVVEAERATGGSSGTP